MNGFGVSGINIVGARGHILYAQKIGGELELRNAVKYFFGMLAENNGFISKEIANGLSTGEPNTDEVIVPYQRGQYLMDIGVRAAYPNAPHAEIELDKSCIYVRFGFINPVDKKDDLPNEIKHFKVALYDHNTRKMSGRKMLTIYNNFFLDECDFEPYPNANEIEKYYRGHPVDGHPNLSLLVYDNHDNLIVPSSV